MSDSFFAVLHVPSDIICHRSVTMAQCTRAFVKDEKYEVGKSQSASEAAYA